MKVTVRLFSLYRDAVDGKGCIILEFRGRSITVREVLEELKTRYPKFKTVVERNSDILVVTVNGEVSELKREVFENDEIAILPLPAGG